MYLFQHFIPFYWWSWFRNLHSTMYLFQLKAGPKQFIQQMNLHSTMYLFQPVAKTTAESAKVNLHSTMYLFQPRLSLQSHCQPHIYIPLCIYFNCGYTIASALMKRFTFHYVSISTLAFQPTVLLCSRFTFHYVSISTGALFAEYHNKFIIYIPLCIYFNYVWCVRRGSVTLFTFHYVSISTDAQSETCRAFLYLHSTMYLFQHAGTRAILDYLCHLHSTMYLFQHTKISFLCVPCLIFTFHYVSISTLPNSKCITIYSNIYIPLCIYFNL